MEIRGNFEEWKIILNTYRQSMEPKRKLISGYVDPASFIKTLSEKMDDDAVYVADVGQNQIWSCAYHIVKDGRFLTSGGMGTMGYSIPAAMGAKYAYKDRQVIAVCGDGSFQMSMMEFATMRQHGIKAKVIVIKNDYLGMVREYQHYTYKDRYSVVDLSGSPELSKIAEAYGMDFIRVKDNSEAEDAIERFLSDENSCLMECDVAPLDLVK